MPRGDIATPGLDGGKAAKPNLERYMTIVNGEIVWKKHLPMTLKTEILFKGTVAQFEAVAGEICVKVWQSGKYPIPPLGIEKPPYPESVIVSLADLDGSSDEVQGVTLGIVKATPRPNNEAQLSVYGVEGWTRWTVFWELLRAELEQQGWIDPPQIESKAPGRASFSKISKELKKIINRTDIDTLKEEFNDLWSQRIPVDRLKLQLAPHGFYVYERYEDDSVEHQRGEVLFFPVPTGDPQMKVIFKIFKDRPQNRFFDKITRGFPESELTKFFDEFMQAIEGNGPELVERDKSRTDRTPDLSRLEKGIIEAYQELQTEGKGITDDAISVRLAKKRIVNKRGEAYTREHINKTRNKLIDKGYRNLQL